ncbi:MAG: pirin family protein [Sulfuricurvum sp.]|nr:pirin family protein [Sulfuricurvum sp.]
MNYAIHRANERGVAEHGWLHSRFSFSFADYHNRERMGFGVLRVINDDVVEPQSGFGMHPHRDMEIVTIVLKGSIEHTDSLGHHGFTNAGEIQVMSAGTGIEHSERNPSTDEPLELFQIWIFPNAHNLPPHYEQRDFRNVLMAGVWGVLVSGDGHMGSMKIAQNANIKMTRLNAGSEIVCDEVPTGYGRLLLVIEGEVQIEGETLYRRDELQTVDTQLFTIHALSQTHLLLFEVPMTR